MPSAREASRPKEAKNTEKDKNPFTGEASIEFRFFFNACMRENDNVELISFTRGRKKIKAAANGQGQFGRSHFFKSGEIERRNNYP